MEWFSVNAQTGDKTLINDPQSAQSIKAYQEVVAPQIQLESATQVTGPFTIENGAVVDSAAKTILIARNGDARFYRLRTGATTPQPSLRITHTAINGGNVVLAFSSE